MGDFQVPLHGVPGGPLQPREHAAISEGEPEVIAQLDRTADAIATRVEHALDELSGLSREGPGVTRLAYSAEDAQARRWFRDRCESAHLRFQVDNIGNCFGWTPAAEEGGALLIGSHLDSVIEAGFFDGTLGVAVALELATYFAQNDPEIPIIAVSFACEESTRFGHGCIGSRSLVGELPPLELREISDPEGTTLLDFLDAAELDEFATADVAFPDPFRGYLEIHIDQGTSLTSRATDVGLVTTICGDYRTQLVFEGEASHSGAQLRDQRRDALVAASEFITRANALWRERDPDGDSVQLTVGYLIVEPNSANTVPGRVTLVVDVRSARKEALVEFTEEIKELAVGCGARSDVLVAARSLEEADPASMDERYGDALARAALQVLTRFAPCVSLAGHDAQVLASYLPTSMLLIANPSGMSHSPAESFDRDALRAALAISLRAVPRLVAVA